MRGKGTMTWLSVVFACLLSASGALGDAAADWLVSPTTMKTTVIPTAGGFVLTNGLVSRTFVTTPAFGTVDLVLNATTSRGGTQSLFRNVKPEGEISLAGLGTFPIGGLRQDRTFLAYCNRSDFSLSKDTRAFQYSSHTVEEPEAPFPWTPGTRHSLKELSWPPKGKRVSVRFTPPPGVPSNLVLTVNYEMYDGIPVMTKWLTLAMEKARAVGDVFMGWNVFSGRMYSYVESVCFQGDAGSAAYTMPSNDVGFSVPAGNAEAQANIGLSTSPANQPREQWDFFLSVDAGSIYISKKGASPTKIMAATPGDAVSVSYKDGKATFLVNGVAQGWLTANVTAPLYPHITMVSGAPICHIAPSSAKPPSPPTPPAPPSPPTTSVQVLQAVVETVGVMPRWGPYFTHGSFVPGADGEGAPPLGAPLPLLHAKTDQAHGASCSWNDDFPNSVDNIPSCASCRDEGAVEPYLNCSYTSSPGAFVTTAGEVFESFRAILLVSDSVELERHTLTRHRATQVLAPHLTENPIFFHATDVSTTGFKETIDAMAEVGFEMLIYSFGTPFHLEDDSEANLRKIKSQIDYAKSKGIEVGGYDLICLDRGGSVPTEYRAVGNEGDACFASGWYDELHGKVLKFINATGLSMLETDGPYGGETCASTTHAHHHDISDSVYRQTQLQNQFYKEMRRLGVYVNQPDDYFYQGGNRAAMGYDEQQYSLPRWRDLSVSRMGLYDDLYIHLPTQGWMFLPLGEYHAGGKAATFEGYLTEYEWALAQYLGAGTSACYRGARPYTTQAIKSVVTKWISWFKAHRDTLIQPIVHIRRADMQSWDGWLHVNPMRYGGKEVGVAMIFNPTSSTLSPVISIPVYYCGISQLSATVTVNDDPPRRVTVNRDYTIHLPMNMPPRSIHRIVIDL